MNKPNNNDQGLNIEISNEVAKGIYSNLAIITHSSSEFVLDFVRILPGTPKAEVATRAIMAPEHAKRLLKALKDNVEKYEKQFGEINIPNNQPSIPMGFMPGGEA